MLNRVRKIIFGNSPAVCSRLPFGIANDHVSRVFFFSGLLLIGIFGVLLSANYFDTRLLNGVSVWSKPIKFSISLSIHFFSLALLAQLIEKKRRVGVTLTLLAYAAVVSMIFEQLYISIQAGRGVKSHFNFSSEFTLQMYALMGVAAFFLVLVSFVLGIMIIKYSQRDDSGYRLGAILGLTFGSVLTLVLGGYLSSNGSHFVGGNVSDADGLAVVGWSKQIGDLRVPHFVATHLIQILPVIGIIADNVGLPARKVVIISTIVLVVVSIGLFFQALQGQPLFG